METAKRAENKTQYGDNTSMQGKQNHYYNNNHRPEEFTTITQRNNVQSNSSPKQSQTHGVQTKNATSANKAL